MVDSYECEFCHSFYSTKSNLLAHQKRAKKCLKIQGKSESESKLYKCEKCTKTFTSKKNMVEHTSKCAEKLETMYRELEKNYAFLDKTSKAALKMKDTLLESKEKQIKELQEQINNLQNKLAHVAEVGAKKDTVRIKNMNNVVNNMTTYDLDKPKIDHIVDSEFTKVHLYDQANGVATFAVTKLLQGPDGKYKMMCTDTARKVFVYKDSEGNLYRDVNADGFLELYMPAVTRKSYDLISTAETTSDTTLDCMKNIEPTTVSTKMASKLVPKPSSENAS